MTAPFRTRLAESYRKEIATLDAIIRSKTEDIARLTDKKAALEARLQRLEGANNAD